MKYLGNNQFSAADVLDGLEMVDDTSTFGDIRFTMINQPVRRVEINFFNAWNTSSTTSGTSSSNFSTYMSSYPGVTHEVAIGKMCFCVPGTNDGTIMALENCAGIVNIAFNESTAQNCANDYTLTRTWTATDNCGRTQDFSQIITVIDTSGPVLANIPADTVVTPSTIPPAPVITGSDNCDTTVTVTLTENTVNFVCYEELTRTWTATDDCGNTTVETQVITINELVVVSASVTSDYNGEDISCVGGNDGTASASGAGGQTPYSYNWSNGQTTAGSSGLSAGIYTVTVTDANGCTATSTVELVDPATLTLTTSIISNNNGYSVSCSNGSNGFAISVASGGVGPYAFLWSNGQTTSALQSVGPGVYTVTVTDENSCTRTATLEMTSPTSNKHWTEHCFKL